MALFAAAAQGQTGGATPHEASSATGLTLNPGNTGRIKLAATFRTGHPGRATEAPVVRGDTLFLMTGFPHSLYALDLARPGIPVRWRFRPEADSAAHGHACCGKGGGGMAVAGGRLCLNTLDGRTIALDADSARVLWAARMADPSLGETLAAAPLPSGGTILLGNAGDRFGVRGWIAALDAADGHLLWRRHGTGPDGEVGIGPEFRPVHGDDGAAERGVVSWPPSAWQRGGRHRAGPDPPGSIRQPG